MDIVATPGMVVVVNMSRFDAAGTLTFTDEESNAVLSVVTGRNLAMPLPPIQSRGRTLSIRWDARFLGGKGWSLDWRMEAASVHSICNSSEYSLDFPAGALDDGSLAMEPYRGGLYSCEKVIQQPEVAGEVIVFRALRFSLTDGDVITFYDAQTPSTGPLLTLTNQTEELDDPFLIGLGHGLRVTWNVTGDNLERLKGFFLTWETGRVALSCSWFPLYKGVGQWTLPRCFYDTDIPPSLFDFRAIASHHSSPRLSTLQHAQMYVQNRRGSKPVVFWVMEVFPVPRTPPPGPVVDPLRHPLIRLSSLLSAISTPRSMTEY